MIERDDGDPAVGLAIGLVAGVSFWLCAAVVFLAAGMGGAIVLATLNVLTGGR